MGETLTPLWYHKYGVMDVLGFMSRSGTNLLKLGDNQKLLDTLPDGCPYRLVGIVSNEKKSKVVEVAAKLEVPFVLLDKFEFRREWNLTRDQAREPFHEELYNRIKRKFDCPVAALGGYMDIIPKSFIQRFRAMENVHPAQLDVLDAFGKRAYIGDDATQKVIASGEEYIYSTVHIVTEKVDDGPILVVSPPVRIQRGKNYDPTNLEQRKNLGELHQNVLKYIGDHTAFPRALEFTARGRFSYDSHGNYYFDEERIPKGVTLDGVVRT